MRPNKDTKGQARHQKIKQNQEFSNLLGAAFTFGQIYFHLKDISNLLDIRLKKSLVYNRLHTANR